MDMHKREKRMEGRRKQTAAQRDRGRGVCTCPEGTNETERLKRNR